VVDLYAVSTSHRVTRLRAVREVRGSVVWQNREASPGSRAL